MDGWCVSFDRLLSGDIKKIEKWIVEQGIDTWAVYDDASFTDRAPSFITFADETTAMMCYMNFS
jgi:hypothetical protein